MGNMSDKSKKNAITLLDAATTRKAVIHLAKTAHARMNQADWPEIWNYAVMRFNRLPDDGTALADPGRKPRNERLGLSEAWAETIHYGASFLTKDLRAVDNFVRAVHKTAQPDVRILVVDEAPEWADWKGKVVDLNAYDPSIPRDLRLRIDATIHAGGAIAMKKAGKWFALRATNSTSATEWSVPVIVLPISEEEAMGLPHLPEHWQTMVSVIR